MPTEPQAQKRAVAYARTSVDSEEEGLKLSIEEQLTACNNLAQNHGYKIIGEYFDRNRSGRTHPTGSPFVDLDPIFEQYFQEHIKTEKCRTRNGLGELFKRLDEIDVILVRDETRLMRPLLNSYLETYVWQKLATHNVIVHSVTEGIISPVNHEQQMISRLKANTKDKDISTRIQDTKASLDRRRNSGDLYRSPFMCGFCSGGHQKVTPIEHELIVVRRIFDMYLAGVPIWSICRALNSEGVKTKSGKGYWGSSPVRSILSRILYAGYQYNTYGDIIESHQFKPHAIISLDEYYRIKEKMGTHKWSKDAGISKGIIHPLSSLVYCGNCGYHLRLFKTKCQFYTNPAVISYYICMQGASHDVASSQVCRQCRVREQHPSQGSSNPIGNALLEFLTPLTYTGFIRHLVEEKYSAGMSDDILKMEREIERIGEVEKKLLDMNMAGKVSDEQFGNLMIGHKNRRNILKSRLAEVGEHFDNIQRISIPVETFQNLQQTKMTPELIRDLCQKAFSRIDIYGDRVRVTLANGGEFEVERMRIKGGRPLPYWRVSIDSPRITLISRIEITYFYTTAIHPRDAQDLEPVKVVYEDTNLKVVKVGKNGVGCYRDRGPGAITGNVVEFGTRVESNPVTHSLKPNIRLLPLGR